MQAFYAGKVIEIKGNLPACVKDMNPVEKYSSFINIDKVMKKYKFIQPENIDWGSVDRNSWFICINHKTLKSYSFPIAESENRDHGYMRPKLGIRHFTNLNYKLYKIQ